MTLSSKVEALIETKARQAGKSADELVREALLHVGETLPWKSNYIRPDIKSKEEFIAALDEIAARSAARPVVDPRSADEIIGYDDFGLPR